MSVQEIREDLSDQEELDLFDEIFWSVAPDLYQDLAEPGVYQTTLISRLADTSPRLYLHILNQVVRREAPKRQTKKEFEESHFRTAQRRRQTESMEQSILTRGGRRVPGELTSMEVPRSLF